MGWNQCHRFLCTYSAGTERRTGENYCPCCFRVCRVLICSRLLGPVFGPGPIRPQEANDVWIIGHGDFDDDGRHPPVFQRVCHRKTDRGGIDCILDYGMSLAPRH